MKNTADKTVSFDKYHVFWLIQFIVFWQHPGILLTLYVTVTEAIKHQKTPVLVLRCFLKKNVLVISLNWLVVTNTQRVFDQPAMLLTAADDNSDDKW